MLEQLNNLKWGPATVLIVAVVLSFVIGGMVVVIVDPSTLTFQDYLSYLWKFLLSVAGLATGRGLHLGLSSVGSGASPVTASDAASPPDTLPIDALPTDAPAGADGDQTVLPAAHVVPRS
jgi:hypothetical protein